MPLEESDNMVPEKSSLNKIYDVNFLLLNNQVLNKNRKNGVIFVHCSDGINLTGYVLCYCLCRWGDKYEQAISKF